MMSFASLGFISILCCFYTTQAENVENKEVLWRIVGESASIHCRHGRLNSTMTLSRGLKKDFLVLNIHESQKVTIHEDFSGRLRVDRDPHTVTVHMSNLTKEDTGPYWCGYEWFDDVNLVQRKAAGEGSVLLVITELAKDKCDKSILLATIGILAAVLIGVSIAFLRWIIPKIRKRHENYKTNNSVSNELYEDMRGRRRP
ncbi:uncharacterized protein LOC144088764 [Stigmatopora argus]